MCVRGPYKDLKPTFSSSSFVKGLRSNKHKLRMQKIRRVVEQVARNLEEHSHICSKQKRESWSPIVLRGSGGWERGGERKRVTFNSRNKEDRLSFSSVRCLWSFFRFPTTACFPTLFSFSIRSSHILYAFFSFYFHFLLWRKKEKKNAKIENPHGSCLVLFWLIHGSWPHANGDKFWSECVEFGSLMEYLNVDTCNRN